MLAVQNRSGPEARRPRAIAVANAPCYALWVIINGPLIKVAKRIQPIH
jgi:hypothetical protein